MIHHSDFVYQIVRLVECKNYLELGVYTGETFSKVYSVVENAVGVDTKDMRKNKIGNFYTCITSEFFKLFNNSMLFDVIFIDADHKFSNVKDDFESSIKILNKNGIIIIHDTDPIDIEHTDFGYCGDSYKIIDYIIKENKYDIITFPIAEAGLSIIKRKSDRRVLEWIK